MRPAVDDALSGVRLQAARQFALCLLGVLLLRWSVVVHTESYAVLSVYGAVVCACAYVLLGGATRRSAPHWGMLLVLLTNASGMVRTWQGTYDEVLVHHAVFGANRVLPFMSAIFYGTRATVVLSALSIAEGALALYLKWDAARDGDFANIFQRKESHGFVAEMFFVVTATLVACSVAGHYQKIVEELAEALKARHNIITNMNHEIRTPLVGIMSIADLVLRSYSLPVPVREHIELLSDSAKALFAMASNILEATRLHLRTRRVIYKTVNVRAPVQDAVDSMRALAAFNKVRLRVVVDPAVPPAVVTDDTIVHQLLSHLVGNAVKFSSGRPVNVVVGVRPLGTTAKQLLGPQPEDAAADATDDAPSSFTLAETAAMTAQYLSGQDSGSGTGRGLRRLSRGGSSGSRREAKAVLRAVWRQQDSRGRLSTTPTPEPHFFSADRPRAPPEPTMTLFFKVSDRGVGVHADDLARIMEPFHQADNSVKRQYGGSGMGLAIVRDLVALIGGSMLFASKPGLGTVVAVAIPCAPASAATKAGGDAARTPLPALLEEPRELPAKPAPPLPLPTTTEAAAPAGNSARVMAGPGREARASRPLVLVVDDNMVNITVLQRQLSALGCDSLVASDGRQAVDIVRQRLAPSPAERPIAAILMDLHMPVMDGMEATRAIRALGVNVPIIVVSADDPASVGDGCEAAGAQAFLRKPFLLSGLKSTLSSWIPMP